MHSETSETNDDAKVRGSNFKDRLHRARSEASSHNRCISWTEVRENDVVGGRGADARDRSGSQFYRNVCAKYSADYFLPPKTKMKKADHQEAMRLMIMDEVLSQGGRFLDPCCSKKHCRCVKSCCSEKCFKNIILDVKRLHLKIQNCMSDIRNSRRTDDDNVDNKSPTTVAVVLDMSRFLNGNYNTLLMPPFQDLPSGSAQNKRKRH